jgi:hypothetical protein
VFAFLAFQLAIGLQIGVAHEAMPVSVPSAVATASTTAASAATTDDACPLHRAPTGKHDCCKSSGCQGQCGSVPLAFNIAPSRNSLASTRVQSEGAERVVVAPADTHFRPPILS